MILERLFSDVSPDVARILDAALDGRDAFAGANVGKDARARAIGNQDPRCRRVHNLAADRWAILLLSFHENRHW